MTDPTQPLTTAQIDRFVFGRARPKTAEAQLRGLMRAAENLPGRQSERKARVALIFHVAHETACYTCGEGPGTFEAFVDAVSDWTGISTTRQARRFAHAVSACIDAGQPLDVLEQYGPSIIGEFAETLTGGVNRVGIRRLLKLLKSAKPTEIQRRIKAGTI